MEVSDQLEVSEYLRDTLHFVDKKRMGIWGKIMSVRWSAYVQVKTNTGWSYGGYVAALALSTSSIFQCGISVAPVTNWKLYGKVAFIYLKYEKYCTHLLADSTYTERFMGLPNLTDNYKGYDQGDLSKHVDQLKDKQFLLVSYRRKTTKKTFFILNFFHASDPWNSR